MQWYSGPCFRLYPVAVPAKSSPTQDPEQLWVIIRPCCAMETWNLGLLRQWSSLNTPWPLLRGHCAFCTGRGWIRCCCFDYAGLGVDVSWYGSHIPHQYFVREAGAHDALNALSAARGSFPRHLSSDYVVMGHSQGGAVAWGLSEILARNHTNNQFEDVGKGYRGAVLAAPPTDALSFTSAGFLAWIAKDLNQIYPSFNLSDWFTPLAVSRIELLNQVEGSQMVTFAMFSPEEAVLQPGWHETWYAKAFEQLTNPGKRPFKGPILLVQGTEDQIVSYSSTKATMQETCKRYPGDPELLAAPQASHFAAINAAKQTLLRWIEDRFEHRPVDRHGCVESQLGSLLPLEYYQVRSNSFPLWAGESHWSYELPTAL